MQRGNGLGPPLFFVLSGALLTNVIDHARNTSHRYRNFLLRRVLRIFPLYFGYLLLAALATLIVTGSGPKHFWVYALFAQNIFIHLSENTGSVLETYHLWTISVQDQFYLVWPLLIWACRNLRQMRLLCWSGMVLSLLSRVLMMGPHVPPEYLVRSLPAVAGCMCLGGLLALEQRQRTWLTGFLHRGLLPLTAICFAWMWIGLDFRKPLGSLVGYQMVAFTCAAFITAAMRPTSAVAQVLSTKFFATGGKKFAFGLYMLHPCLLNLCIHDLPFESKLLRLSIFLMGTIILAGLSYRFYESPFLQMNIGRGGPEPARKIGQRHVDPVRAEDTAAALS